ncbi:hypothetical protein ACIPYQ_05635 [Streptomyces sp. NPDC090045]|uniref:hypothetical protein n=1 Tax=Streptomyces sp. NPDC090045 TaxID=3365927 RepID=UPI00381A0D64
MNTMRIGLAYVDHNNTHHPAVLTHSWSGSVSGLGPISLAFPVNRDMGGFSGHTTVSGVGLPHVLFSGVPFRGYPRMAGIELSVDGRPARVSRRHLGLTKRGRALRIRIDGRDYRYQVLGSKRQHELSRAGAAVRMSRSDWRLPSTISGTAQGQADGLDVALAVVLEGVYTRNLSFSGAVYSWPGRFFSRFDAM